MDTFAILADASIAARHDPTWIYSTLAQTAGALVGVLGAVLIGRVISHMNELQPRIAGIRQSINSVLAMAQENLSTVMGRLNVSSFGTDGMAWYALLAERFQRFHQQLAGEVNRDRLPEYIAPLRECVDKFPASANPSLCSNDLRRPIQGNITYLEELRDRLANLDEKLVPRPLWVVFLLLAFLSVVGVAWPLVELAVLTDESSWRLSALLVSFVGGVFALVAYFFYLLRELRVLGRFQWRTSS